ALAEPGSTTVSTLDCAGWWRRCAAFAIDVVVVLAIINSFAGSANTLPVRVQVTGGSQATPAPRRSGAHAQPSPEGGAQERFGPLVFNEVTGPRLELGWLNISAQ